MELDKGIAQKSYFEEIFGSAAKRAVNHNAREGAVQGRGDNHCPITFRPTFLASFLFLAEVAAESLGKRYVRSLLANGQQIGEMTDNT